ncbi:unnamed protein product [Echinostoma caproni]|uniref:CUB domain-containing protein n=1 Tax=Echinostoma caproni TaxID=27848 RepID=A0A183AWZ1_9TREM|nr:unnamed protein product [Echinostoma caproni]
MVLQDIKKCGETNLVANEAPKELILPKEAAPDCKWNITTTTWRTIQLSWPKDSAEDCVKLEGPSIAKENEEWCAKTAKNVQAKAYVIVTRKPSEPSLPASNQEVKEIKLFYQLVNDAECSTGVAKPTVEIQSLMYLQEQPHGQMRCVKVTYADSTSSTTPQEICGEEGKNVFTADVSKAVIVTFENPSGSAGSEMENFKVYYQLVNDNRCADTPNPPTDKTQSFSVAKSVDVIPAGLLCAWSLPTTGGKKIRVTLDVDSAKNENQCVTVTDADKTKTARVCGKEQQNTFISGGKDVTVTFGEQSAEKTDVANFKIYYQLDVGVQLMSSTILLIACPLVGMYTLNWYM